MLTHLAAESTRLSRTGGPGFAATVLNAMASVARHEYVPSELTLRAYGGGALPIGFGKTTSQPFVVALMLDLLHVAPEDRVLEVGTGLGYQAALLSTMANRVYTVEAVPGLASDARARLRRRELDNVFVKLGDGRFGWPEHGPFDKILVTAATELLLPDLLHQLRPGGRLVAPLGRFPDQRLSVVDKAEDGRIVIEPVMPVRFSRLAGGTEFFRA